MPLRPGFDVDRFNRFGKEFLPGFVGLLITEVSEGLLKGELELRKALLAGRDCDPRRRAAQARAVPLHPARSLSEVGSSDGNSQRRVKQGGAVLRGSLSSPTGASELLPYSLVCQSFPV